MFVVGPSLVHKLFQSTSISIFYIILLLSQFFYVPRYFYHYHFVSISTILSVFPAGRKHKTLKGKDIFRWTVLGSNCLRALWSLRLHNITLELVLYALLMVFTIISSVFSNGRKYKTSEWNLSYHRHSPFVFHICFLYQILTNDTEQAVFTCTSLMLLFVVYVHLVFLISAGNINTLWTGFLSVSWIFLLDFSCFTICIKEQIGLESYITFLLN